MTPNACVGSGFSRTDNQHGYAMAALLVALVVMSIMATAVMPVWKHAGQREKETELIFRGQQYARAIGLFQRKSGPGTLPLNIDALVDQRFLRKKLKDPITNDDFQPLLAGQAVAGAQPGGAQPAQGARGIAPATPPAAGGASGRAGFGSVGAAAPGSTTTPGRGGAGGIMGVASKSTEKSIRLYNSRTHYNEWAFVYVPPVQAPGAPGAGGVPGVGGQRGPGPQGGVGGVGGRPTGPGGRGAPIGPGGGRGGPFGPGGRGGPVTPILPVPPQQSPPRR